MSAVLNTNTASLWASKNLLGAQTRLATSVERLASGLRINRARDDAAGMGVAASLTAQINGANQGIRNLNDAVSSMQTGEGALAAAQEMGQRMLMLATQGANSTLGVNERTSIVDELKKIVLAIDAIGGRTTFAGNPLLSRGTMSPNLAVFYSMQISNTPSDRIALDSTAFQNVGGVVGVAKSAATNVQTASTTAAAAVTAGATALTLQVASVAGINVGDTVTIGTNSTTVKGISGNTLTLNTALTANVAIGNTVTTTRRVLELSSAMPDNIVGRYAFKVSADGTMSALSTQVLATTASNGANAGALTLSVASAVGISVGDAITLAGTTAAVPTGTTVTAINGTTLSLSQAVSGAVTLGDNVTITRQSQVLKATADDKGRAGLSYAISGATLTLSKDDIIAFGDGKAVALGASLTAAGLTADPATDPTVITTAWQTVQTRAAQYVKDITAQRGLMGAYQNQMEYTLSNLTELSSNLASARSRVIDTDYASETAALTRGQILQQAATAMLAQANQMPNIILTLLK